MKHSTVHPLAGKTVTLKPAADDPYGEIVNGAEFVVEDWYDRVNGSSWMRAAGNLSAMKYAIRIGSQIGQHVLGKVKPDDEVVYGKIGCLGHIVHTTELGEVVS